MTVKLGINPITWINDDLPWLGGDTKLETVLAEAHAAGYRGIEMGGTFPRESNALAAFLAAHRLELVSGWYDGRILERDVAEEFDAVLPHLTLLRDLGCQVVVYADTSRGRREGIAAPISQRPRLAPDEWAPYGRKVTELAERMAAFGVGMAFHHHMGTIVETDAEIDRLMAVSGSAVGLLFDTGHCMFAGGDPQRLLARHLGRVVHVHCKDVRRPMLERAREADMSFKDAFLDGIFTVPGDGCVDFPPLLRLLRDHAYRGWLVVEAEQDPAKAHPLTYAKLGYGNLRRMALASGMTVADATH
jgi:inosose dehydratase